MSKYNLKKFIDLEHTHLRKGQREIRMDTAKRKFYNSMY